MLEIDKIENRSLELVTRRGVSRRPRPRPRPLRLGSAAVRHTNVGIYKLRRKHTTTALAPPPPQPVFFYRIVLSATNKPEDMGCNHETISRSLATIEYI